MRWAVAGVPSQGHRPPGVGRQAEEAGHADLRTSGSFGSSVPWKTCV